MSNDTITTQEIEFLNESNAIEDVYSDEALEDAVNAWKYAKTLDLMQMLDIMNIHELLMKRLNPAIAGNFRKCDVWIGGQKKEYSGADVLVSQLVDITNYIINSFKLETNEEKIDACKKAHVMFEEVHPFLDGNGRTGRVIYNWHRLKLGLPLHIIHAGIELQDYYAWFR